MEFLQFGIVGLLMLGAIANPHKFPPDQGDKQAWHHSGWLTGYEPGTPWETKQNQPPIHYRYWSDGATAHNPYSGKGWHGGYHEGGDTCQVRDPNGKWFWRCTDDN